MELTAPPGAAGQRLDHWLQRELPAYSRSRLQEWIKSGRVRVNGGEAKASAQLRGGEQIDVEPAEPPPLNAFAEDLPVRVLYEDAAVIAVDKPAGMVVHAGAGHHAGTLVNALLHRYGSLSTAGSAERPGIVHRIDKETSGVVLIARTDAAHRALAAQFAARTVEKHYTALVRGVIAPEQGRVEAPIERDPVKRTRMTCRTTRGRAALTTYQVLRRFERHTLLDVRIHTGRTHQIRVHMAHIGHAVAGDTLYGAPKTDHGRFFLHAAWIAFDSPAAGRVKVESPLAPELAAWLTSV